jgi:hypothetical protein
MVRIAIVNSPKRRESLLASSDQKIAHTWEREICPHSDLSRKALSLRVCEQFSYLTDTVKNLGLSINAQNAPYYIARPCQSNLSVTQASPAKTAQIFPAVYPYNLQIAYCTNVKLLEPPGLSLLLSAGISSCLSILKFVWVCALGLRLARHC